MSLIDRLGTEAPAFDCASYEAAPDSKRCRHYVSGGGCSLPGADRCIEWLKVNGPLSPQEPASRPPAPPTAPSAGSVLLDAPGAPGARDLFGNALPSPVVRPPPAVTKPRGVADPSASPGDVLLPPPARLSPEEIESFKALRVSLRFESPTVGEMWLVPAYTGQDRKEISIDHLVTLQLLMTAFPGSKVTSFDSVADAPAPTGDKDAS